MSLLSDDSPNSGSKNSKKRMRDAVWQNFSEINDGEDIKMKCNECQQVVAKHKTSISSHWSYKHKDKMQPPEKSAQAAWMFLLSRQTGTRKYMPLYLPFCLFIYANEHYPPSSYASSLPCNVSEIRDPRQFFVAQIYTAELICSFSLTCDVWTDSGLNNAYLGVTLHCTDSTATLRRICLGLQQLKGSHTGTLIRRETEKILSIYGLCTANAFKVVTDGGSNMIKAYSKHDIRNCKCDSFLFDPLFFVAAALDPNTAGFLTEKDFNTALREIQNLVKYEEPQENTTRTTSFALNATLDQLLGS
uniref:BED-type domain-containing protein n=1 Tax=Ditylenchus dipsaci TaxID=166011 RepID=A0A915CWE9_9BILA